jgi:hypothetical protein
MNKADKNSIKQNDTERENKINIYDNDEAYMLNDDKDNNDIDELEMENQEMNAARGNYDEVNELSDDETIRKEQNEEEEKERKIF